MNLTEEEKEDLIEFLAENLPDFPMRKAVTSDAGMADLPIGGDAAKSWTLLITEAMSRGRLRGLLMSAARQSPGDPAMQAMAEGLKHGKIVIQVREASTDWGSMLLTGGIGLVMLIALGVVGVMYGPQLLDSTRRGPPPGGEATDVDDTDKPDTKVEVRHGLSDGEKPAGGGTEPRSTAPTTAPDGTAPAPGEAPGEGDPEASGDPEGERPGGGKYFVIKDPTEQPAGSSNTGCGGKQGTVIGYASVGTTQPTVRGGVWSSSGTATVRVAYPTPDNGFNSDAKIICTVPGASSVPAGEPFTVDDGTWWVPVMGSGN